MSSAISFKILIPSSCRKAQNIPVRGVAAKSYQARSRPGKVAEMLRSILPENFDVLPSGSQAEASSSPQAQAPQSNQSATRTRRNKETIDYAEEKDSDAEDLGDLSDGSEYLLEPEVLLDVEGKSKQESEERSKDESGEEEPEEEGEEQTGKRWIDKNVVARESDAEEEDNEEVTEARIMGKKLREEFLANQDLGQEAEAVDLAVDDPIVDDSEDFQVHEPVLLSGFKLYPTKPTME